MYGINRFTKTIGTAISRETLSAYWCVSVCNHFHRKEREDQPEDVPMGEEGAQEGSEVEGGEGEDGEEDKTGGAKTRVRHTIYQKVLAIRELDRLLEAGVKHGLEKKVMETFPAVFMGVKGKFKSGMLGRWLVQCDEQRWKEIPWEKMNEKDRKMKELPDWVRLPFGMTPRSLDRFKSGTNVPAVIVKSIISTIERLTCGGDKSRLTCGTVNAESIKEECETLLKVYAEAQEKEAAEKGVPIPRQKTTVSIRWVNRLLEHYGWKRHAPNTVGAYLDYDDERMQRSRKC